MGRRKRACRGCPAIVAVALSMVALSPAAYGQKAWLDLRPLGAVSADGSHSVYGWCGDMDGGTSCSSNADCVGDANGEQCYQTIELDSDNQEVYFEAWISNWAAFPNRTCWTPINGPLDTGVPCTTQTDCSGPEICGGSILTYTVGLDCSGYDNGTGVLEVPFTGSSCGDGFILLPPDGFCADVDRNDADWIHANAVSTIAGLNAFTLCPQGEQPLPWFPGGSVVSGGIGNDGTTDLEAYLATYAVRVPAGGTGTWELFLEDDQDDPSNVQIRHDNFPADNYFVDFNIPLTITVATGLGRCCGHPGASSTCVDGITGEECLAAGGAQFREGQSCSGVDADGDGVDDGCDNCNLFNPDQADCNSNGIGDVCDIANCTGDPACADCNRNGVPDECDIANGLNLNCDEPVPTVSTWGLVILALLLTVAGKVYFGRRRDPMTA